MEFEEYYNFLDALQKYIEDEQQKHMQAIKRYMKKRSSWWQLWKYRGIMNDDMKNLSKEDAYRIIESQGIPRSELQPYLESVRETKKREL